MIKCPKCATANPDGARFCKACRTPIPATGDVKRCPNGHIMDLTWKFCPICQQNREMEPSKKAVHRRRTVVTSGKEEIPQQAGPRRKTKVEGSMSGSVPQTPRKQRRKTVVYASQKGAESSATTLSRLVGFLVTYSHEPSGAYFVLREGRHIIGAGDRTDITIRKDRNISSEHAVLLYRRGLFLMRDNLSTNGTYLNGREITGDVQLKNYDKIKMGDTEFTLIVIDPTVKS